jgi:acyl dehydratase
MPGVYFEELTVGRIFVHAIRRTVTEADNVFFSALTMNPAALHLDEEYCREHTEFKQRIVNSAFTLGLVVGLSVGDTTLGTTVANLGWDEVRFPETRVSRRYDSCRERSRRGARKQIASQRRHRRVRPSWL